MVRIYESQLPFGFCLTFDGVGGFYTMPSLRWVSIAFRLLPHFRLSPQIIHYFLGFVGCFEGSLKGGVFLRCFLISEARKSGVWVALQGP